MATENLATENLWSIGELAERARVTVKTVRFYSERGLLPEAARSAGGHRRYGPEALERLALIRSLRGLDLPVPQVGRILERADDLGDPDGLGDALEDAVAGQLRELGSRMAALRWREAALRLLRDSPAGERAGRLRLIGAIATPPSTAPMARFWRGWLPPRLPARLVSAITEAAVPQPPADPAPGQVLAFARLHAFVAAPCDGRIPAGQPAVHRPEEGYRPAVLYDGLREACALGEAELRAGRNPRPGEALDCFVAAYAGSHGPGVRDTPGFRRRLSAQLAADPRIDHYWRLASEVLTPPSAPPEPTLGGSHEWLRLALEGQVAGETCRSA